MGISFSSSNIFGPYFLLTDTLLLGILLGFYFVSGECGHNIYILMIEKIVVKKTTDLPSTSCVFDVF